MGDRVLNDFSGIARSYNRLNQRFVQDAEQAAQAHAATLQRLGGAFGQAAQEVATALGCDVQCL